MMAIARETDGQLPPILPPIAAVRTDWRRHVAPVAAFGWLLAGWRDFVRQPWLSLVYGSAVFVGSLVVVYSIFNFGYDYILFPALSGFLVIAPLAATGLYEKSRCLAVGKPVTLGSMLFVRISSGGQIVFVGLLLCLLMVLWNRAAILLYALFFGLLPFTGLDTILPVLIGTPYGWGLLIVGSLIGGVFAAFSFAISVFAIPRLLDERTDALTAMGQSMALVWNNLPVMLTWAAIIVFLFGLCVLTGLLGLIIVFPVLGHATWHAYSTMRGPHIEAPDGEAARSST
ncbi:MAG: putative cytochrome c oxidase, subunit I [Pseudolabrys sp.]|jgi:uncharacterized membrane protein|nr:putative cytochrome c oxidase, subunit I [Pseudolabrys sp.]